MKKIFTLLLAFLALATGMQATDYGFSICGNAITSDNYQSQSSGKAWSYDPAANVLHLKDGTIDSDAVAIAIHSNNPTLNVSVDGNCELYGKFDCGISIAGNGNHTFSGNGTLSIRSSVVSSTGITVSGNNSKPSVTFKDLSVSIKQYGGVGFNTSSFASITFEHCDFDINTSDGMAMMTTNTSACTPRLILCDSNRGWTSDHSGSGYRGISGEDLFAPNVKITRAIKYVGVNVAEPVPGQKPVTTATTISSGYKVLSVEWKKKIYGNFYSLEANEVIQLGETYQVSFDLEAQGDSIFNWDDESEAAMIFTVNGNKADFSNVGTERRAYMEYTFPALVGTSYDLWIGGVQVNDANKEDVLGDGAVSYNPESLTLSINKEVTIRGNNTDPSFNQRLGCGIYSEIDGLTINVRGYGIVYGDEGGYEGIYLKGNTTIKGNSQLIASGYTAILMGVNAHSLVVGGNVTLLAAGTDSGGLIGYMRTRPRVEYLSTLTVKDNATMRVMGAENGTSIGSWAEIILGEGFVVTTPAGATVGSHSIVDASGNDVKGQLVTIVNKSYIKGDVNGDKSVTIADGVAVLNAMAGQAVPGNPDVNNDGDVTIADFVAVLNIMAGQ